MGLNPKHAQFNRKSGSDAFARLITLNDSGYEIKEAGSNISENNLVRPRVFRFSRQPVWKLSTVNIVIPACRVVHSCETEFFWRRKMFSTLPCKEWFHSKPNETSYQCTHSIANSQQSQGKLSLFHWNVSWDGVGRVQHYHPRHETKSRTQSDDDPNVRHKMVPRLEQEEYKMSHFQRCIGKNNNVIL